MLTESFITSIRAQHKSANTAIAKDVGIHLHTLSPAPKIESTFKKSSTPVNALAANSTHIFAAQADKAVVHVYSRERGNQEALISFPERIHSLTLVGDGVLILGTAEGRVILWEVYTGRQVSTPAAHLQAITCLAADQSHLITASEDSNVNVWSIANLLSLTSVETQEPLRTLSNHRAAITSVVIGHSASTTNICVSASKDNTCIVWDYLSATLLRTFLLPTTPLCLALDPCDRAVYVGFEGGSLQQIDFSSTAAALNPLYDAKLQDTPVQVTKSPWTASFEAGAAHCIGLSFDGTTLLCGHASGKISRWDTAQGQQIGGELADLNAPVTNLIMLSPFPEPRNIKALTIVKPKLGEGPYILTAQFNGRLSKGPTPFDVAVQGAGFPAGMLESAISNFSQSTTTSGGGNDSEKLRKENEELWKVVNEQRALQQKTWEKYSKLKSERAP
ncbi:Pre-rRNA-processing protein crb3/ipi3 [Phlyctema vagabunda]|uniref:Pre-rRNA-processing protein IPI3 n=1 Tax=Phlyctema vagabunda TaxID=108571 RepID=A0ABR4P9N0_9HELO